jgi:hypothetical protein
VGSIGCGAGMAAKVPPRSSFAMHSHNRSSAYMMLSFFQFPNQPAPLKSALPPPCA